MKKVLITSIGLLFVLLIINNYVKSDFEKSAPTLYFNGNIITVDDNQPIADAMLIIDGKIEAIGKIESIDHTDIENLRKKDLKGATVMPGFVDAHTHFILSMFFASLYDLSGFKHNTKEEVWQHFEETCKQTTDNNWLIFKGLDQVLVKGIAPPTIQYLDSIAPNNPVLIFSQSLHSYWANSMAFQKAGIHKDTPNPSDHSFYERDSTGDFTGLIVEQEAFRPFNKQIKEEYFTLDMVNKAAEKIMLDYSKNGNTTIVSTGLTIEDKQPLILTEHLSAEHPTFVGGFMAKIGLFPSRKPMPRHFIYLRHDMAHLMPEKKGKPNDFYDIIGIKHWYDGSPYIGSMYIDEPYLETDLTLNKLAIPEHYRGEALVSQDELKTFIKEYHSKGWQIALHTQGDAAISEVVKAYKYLDSKLDYSNSRHRLEHCLLLPVSELNTIKQLNLTPSFHVNHLYYYGEALFSDILGEERTNKLLPINSAINNDVIISLHSDQPMFESQPFRLMQTAVERKTNAGRIIGKNEKIELIEAIKALTINAAWQINMENKIGSLEKGKYADFIILNQNPFNIAIEKLHQIKCAEVYINGNKVKF